MIFHFQFGGELLSKKEKCNPLDLLKINLGEFLAAGKHRYISKEYNYTETFHEQQDLVFH